LSSTKSKSPLGPRDERRDDAPGVHLLSRVRDDAGLHEVHEPVREHLGVHAQVVVPAEARQHRVRDAADAHLQRRAVGDERRHLLADAHLHVAEHRARGARAAAGSSG
jgi:hypothetical protein